MNNKLLIKTSRPDLPFEYYLEKAIEAVNTPARDPAEFVYEQNIIPQQSPINFLIRLKQFSRTKLPRPIYRLVRPNYRLAKSIYHFAKRIVK